jgi:DNA ligase (NAD+)
MTIEEQLEQANVAYRTGSPIMSDMAYDALLEKLPKDHPFHLKVGFSFGNTEKLPQKLGSLNKVKEVEDYLRWLPSKSLTYYTPKLDGLTLELKYEQGELIGAWTRGNGIEGTNVLGHALNIPTVPKSAQDGIYVGECIMSNSVFKEKYSEEYSNPRNLASGILGKETSDDRAKDLTFICFSIVSDMGDEAFDPFVTVPFMLTQNIYDEEGLNKLSEDLKSQVSDFDCDGMVIHLADKSVCDKMGFESNGLNPKYARAWKPQIGAGTLCEVLDIDWRVSKNGNFTPVANIAVTEIGGVMISNVTAHNYKLLEDQKIGPGAIVEVIRAGDVIPKIIGVYKESDKKDFSISKCPHCNGKVYIEGVNLTHDWENCPQAIASRAEFMLSTLGVEGIKLKTISKLKLKSYESILDKDVSDFKAIGFSDETANRAVSDIKKSIIDIDEAKFMHATSCFSPVLGERKLRDIISNSESTNNMIFENEASLKSKLLKIAGFSDKSVDYFLKKIESYIDILKYAMDKGLSLKEFDVIEKKDGMNFVFTGFRDKDAQAEIESKGGSVKSSVSKNTNFLVMKDPSKTSSKTKKANELGIKIISIEEMKELI